MRAIGAGDRLDTNYFSDSGQKTFVFWAFANTWGTSNRLFIKQPTPFQGGLYSGASSNLVAEFGYTGGTAQYEWTAPSTSTLHHFVVLADFDDGSIPWELWIDGVQQTRNVTTASSGGVTAQPTVPWRFFGNSTGTLSFDGEVGEVAVFERLLTDEEIVSLSQGFSPAFFRPYIYMPLIDGVQDVTQNHTITDINTTTQIVHSISVIYPQGQLDLPQDPAQAVTLPLLSASATINAPSLTVGAVDVSLPLLSAAASLSSPAIVVGSVDVILPLLSASATLNGPELEQNVSSPLLLAPATLNSPELEQQVVLPLLSAPATLNSPNLGSQVQLPLLNALAVLFSPELEQDVRLTFLSAPATLHAQTLLLGAVDVSLPLLVAPAVFFAPMVTGGVDQDIRMPSLGAFAVLFEPMTRRARSFVSGRAPVPLIKSSKVVD